MDDVRPGLRNLVVNLGRAGQEALAAVRGHVEGVQAQHVAQVRVEGLGARDVGRVGHAAVLLGHVLDHLLDVQQHAAVKVLHAARLGDVGRDAQVDQDVVVARVSLGLEPAQDDEAATLVDRLGDLVELGAQRRKGEGRLVDVVGAEVAGEGCVFIIQLVKGLCNSRLGCEVKGRVSTYP